MKVLGTLTSSPDGPWVTFKQGKVEIRKVLRKAGFSRVSTFRPRSQNRQQFRIEVELEDRTPGVVTAARKPGADIIFTPNS